MPFKRDPLFIEPGDPTARVWRYMDLWRFLALIENQALHFSRVDMFDDRHEGSWPRSNVVSRRYRYSHLSAEDSDRQKVADATRRDGHAAEFPWLHAVNCWHLSEHESEGMWRLYVPAGKGVAVQSTYGDLCSSFTGPDDVRIGKVSYIDYETVAIGANRIAPLMHKRLSFAHEMEIRAVATLLPQRLDDGTFNQNPTGVMIPVDIHRLIRRVYVAPNTASWAKCLMHQIVDRYELDAEIVQSHLDDEPLY